MTAAGTRCLEGVLGRPSSIPAELRELILQAREAGHSLRAIAEHLSLEAVPMAQGGARWHASTVRVALRAG